MWKEANYRLVEEVKMCANCFHYFNPDQICCIRDEMQPVVPHGVCDWYSKV